MKQSPAIAPRTNLAQQLNRLANREKGSTIKVHGLKSFLFESKEAATYDIDSVFLLGTNGLTELSTLDSRFSEFQGTLFSVDLRGVEPDGRTEAELSQTDQEISKLCLLLSPHFMKRAAHKVIEYLIRNFNAFSRPSCVDSLILCSIPFHEAAAFGRLLPVLTLSGKWEWLRPLAKQGIPLSREALSTQCKVSPSLLKWFSDQVINANSNGLLSAHLSTLIAAVTSHLFSGISQSRQNLKEIIRFLLPTVVDCLKDNNDSVDSRSLSCAIISQIITSTSIDLDSASSLLSLLIAAFYHDSLATNTSQTLPIICSTASLLCSKNKRISLSQPTLNPFLLSFPSWHKQLFQLSTPSNFDVSSFVFVICQFLLNVGIKSKDNLTTTTTSSSSSSPISEKDEDIEMGNGQIVSEASWDAISDLISLPLSSSIAKKLCQQILSSFSAKTEEEQSQEDSQKLSGLLKQFSLKFPKEFDSSVDLCLKNNTNNEWLFEVLKVTFSGTIHQPLLEGGVLSAALYHPEASIRSSALEKLDELASSNSTTTAETNFLDPNIKEIAKQAVIDRLIPDEEDIVLEKILSMSWALNLVEPKILFTKTLALLARTTPKVLGLTASKMCLELLVNGVVSRAPEFASKILEVCWSRLSISHGSSRADRLFADACSSLQLPLCSSLPHIEFESNNDEENAVTKKLTFEQRFELRNLIVNAIASNVVSNPKELIQKVIHLSSFGSYRGEIVSLLVLITALQSPSLQSADSRIEIANAILSLLLPIRETKNTQEEKQTQQETDALKTLLIVADSKNPEISSSLSLSLTNATLAGAQIPSFSSEADFNSHPKEISLLRSVFFGVSSMKLNSVKTVIELILSFFKSTISMSKFLSSILIHSSSTVCSKIRALSIASILLSTMLKRGDDSTKEIEILLTTLFIPLQSEIPSVRTASLCFASFISKSKVSPNSLFLIEISKVLLAARSELSALPTSLIAIFEPLRSKGSWGNVSISEKSIIEFGSLLSKFACSIDEEMLPHSRQLLLAPSFTLAPSQALSSALNLLLKMPSRKIGSELMKFIISLHTPSASNAIKSQESFSPFLNCISVSEPGESAPVFCVSALNMITPQFWNSLPNACQSALLSKLLGISALCGGAIEKNKAKEILRSLDIDSKQLEPFLSLPKTTTTTTTTLSQTALAIVGSALEVLEERCDQLETLSKPLIPSIFGIIRALVDEKHEASKSPSREYTLQITLSALSHITASLVDQKQSSSKQSNEISFPQKPQEPQQRAPMKFSSPPKVVSSKAAKQRKEEETAKATAELEQLFDVEIITQCIKAVNSPQVHLQALSVLASAASLIPAVVLKHAVEVFSFVAGSSTAASSAVRTQDDLSTLKVLRKAIKGIVPPMLLPGGSGPAPIVLSLVNGFQTIPRHRRSALFTTVIECIGNEKLAYVLVSLILCKQVSSEAENDIQTFAHKLCLSFKPSISVSALSGLVRLSLGNIAEEWKPFIGNNHPNKVMITALNFVESHVSSREFVQSLFETFEDEIEEEEEEEEEQMIDENEDSNAEDEAKAQKQLLTLFEDAACVLSQSSQQQQKLLGDAARGVLSAVKNVLTLPAFIGAIIRLLRSKSETARRSGLVLLNDKLEDISPSITNEEASLFLDNTSETSITTLICSMLQPTESTTARQTALLTLEILARALASKNQDKFVELLSRPVKELSDKDESVSTSALLCVATFVSQLQKRSIIHLPNFMPILLDKLEAAIPTKSATTTTTTMTKEKISAIQPPLSALRVVVKYISAFISPYAPRIVSLLLRPELLNFESASQILSSLTEQVESRIMLDPLFASFHTVPSSSLPRLLDVIRDVISRMKPTVIANQHISIYKFFIENAFSLYQRPEITPQEIRDTEPHAVNAFVQLVIKLSEASFKPIFLSLNHYFHDISARSDSSSLTTARETKKGGDMEDEENAEESDNESEEDEPMNEESRNAAILYCSILSALAERLRGLFVPYLGYFVGYLVDHLIAKDSYTLVQRLAAAAEEEEEEEQQQQQQQNGNKRTRSEDELEPTQEAETKLKGAALDALRICLTYDTQGYANSNFEQLIEVTQVADNWAIGEENYSELMRSKFIPCIAALASAVSNERAARWKDLNHRLLLLTKSDRSEVRRRVLDAIIEIWNRNGEGMINVLSDTVPYVNELLQDSDQDVINATNRLCEVIQSYLGEESLHDYLV